MLDATVEEDDVNSTTDASGNRRLTEEQIIAHSVTFMMAGHETTANTLGYTAYLLALNPHVQEKLQSEIDKYFKENPVICGESMQ